MFDAIFTASSGQSFSFGYKAGVLYSIDPIGDLPVELETSQGYQQVGATVESRSISGVTRTITGRILRNTAYLKRQLRDIFTPGATGRLTVAGKYYCDAEVQRCPAISAATLWPTFSFQLFCPNPYWHAVSQSSVTHFQVTPTFRLPACYSSHQYGLRLNTDNLRFYNNGLDTQDYVLTLTAQGDLTNPGVKDVATGEYLRFVTEMQEGDRIRFWREAGQVRIEQTIDDASYNAMELLDESSTLWTLRHGSQRWERTADRGVDNLYLTLSYGAAYASLVAEVDP